MQYWAQRQRDTNRLARILAKHVLNRATPSAGDLYAIAKLSWITDSYEGASPAYIRSTKIPALGELLGVDYGRSTTLATIAAEAVKQVGRKEVAALIQSHTGFTNFYNAYRNSVRKWVKKHHSKLLPLYRAALNARTDRDRLQLITAIGKLPGIPKANYPDQLMRPECFLTPVFFMLDPQIKFPIINGNEWVQALLDKLDAGDADLATQYEAMVGLYGRYGINDAADLDQLGRDLPDFLDTLDQKATKQLLQHRSENERDLGMKDEADYAAARDATTVVHRKIHNQLTNQLREGLGKRLMILEGANHCKFDALVKRYDGENDLLIEVKSSAEVPHLRMAVGQLFHYWFQQYGEEARHMAILTPTRPAPGAIELLEHLDVGVLWFERDMLATCTSWLSEIAIEAKI